MRWWDVEPAAALEIELFGGTAWSPETFWSELAQAGTRRYTVAEDGSGLVGYAGLMVNGSQADVQTVAVAPRTQRVGLGRRLLEDLLAEAGARGVRTVLLEVRADNAPAIALYARCGFEQIAVRRRYYPDGSDAAIMKLQIGRDDR
jgi:ribosomal-protein-alanine N-acetyltransferase